MNAVVLADLPGAAIKLCGVAMIERLLRVLQRLGFSSATVLRASREVREILSRPSWARDKLRLEFANALPPGDTLQLVIPANVYCDPRLLTALIARGKAAWLVDSKPPAEWSRLLARARRSEEGLICGPEIRGTESETLDVASLDPYDESLRCRLHPLWFPAPEPENIAVAERLILDHAQKRLLDVRARLHWPFENVLVRCLWRTAITPNQVTFFGAMLGCVGTVALARGDWWLGTIITFVFAILDGVDGKLARVKVETTQLGKIEHYPDQALEYSWWLALAYSLGRAGLAHAGIYAVMIIAGDLLGKYANRLVAAHTGRPSHRESQFERYFRLFGGRRDIYTAIFLFGLIVRRPGAAFAVCGWWSIVSVAIQALRTIAVRLR